MLLKEELAATELVLEFCGRHGAVRGRAIAGEGLRRRSVDVVLADHAVHLLEGLQVALPGGGVDMACRNVLVELAAEDLHGHEPAG